MHVVARVAQSGSRLSMDNAYACGVCNELFDAAEREPVQLCVRVRQACSR